MEAKASNKKSSKAQTKKKSYKALVNEIFDGSFMTKDALRRNIKLILLVVACIFIYISNHYAVIMNLSEIDSLQTKLTDVKYETLTISSQLMRESRQSFVRQMVNDRGLSLEDSTTPPFKITKE